MNHWIMENKKVQIIVTSGDIGFNISSLYQKKIGREWMYYHNGKMAVDTDSFDEQFHGGGEFIFPNDTPYIWNKKSVDHGFLWKIPYTSNGVEETQHHFTVKLMGYIEELKVQVLFRILLSKEEADIELQAAFTNKGSRAIPFLFRFHPSFRGTPDTKLKLNGRNIILEGETPKPSYCSFKTAQMHHQFPLIQSEKTFDVESMVQSQVSELFCHIEQTTGAFEIHQKDASLKVSYQHQALPYLTIYYTIINKEHVMIIEPSTSKNANLKKLIELGQEQTLKVNETKEYRIRIALTS